MPDDDQENDYTLNEINTNDIIDYLNKEYENPNLSETIKKKYIDKFSWDIFLVIIKRVINDFDFPLYTKLDKKQIRFLDELEALTDNYYIYLYFLSLEIDQKVKKFPIESNILKKKLEGIQFIKNIYIFFELLNEKLSERFNHFTKSEWITNQISFRLGKNKNINELDLSLNFPFFDTEERFKFFENFNTMANKQAEVDNIQSSISKLKQTIKRLEEKLNDITKPNIDRKKISDDIKAAKQSIQEFEFERANIVDESTDSDYEGIVHAGNRFYGLDNYVLYWKPGKPPTWTNPIFEHRHLTFYLFGGFLIKETKPRAKKPIKQTTSTSVPTTPEVIDITLDEQQSDHIIVIDDDEEDLLKDPFAQYPKKQKTRGFKNWGEFINSI